MRSANAPASAASSVAVSKRRCNAVIRPRLCKSFPQKRTGFAVVAARSMTNRPTSKPADDAHTAGSRFHAVRRRPRPPGQWLPSGRPQGIHATGTTRLLCDRPQGKGHHDNSVRPRTDCRDHRLAGRAFALAAPARLLAASGMASTAPMCRCRSDPRHFTTAVRGLARSRFRGAERHDCRTSSPPSRCATRWTTSARRAGAVNTFVFQRRPGSSAATPTACGFVANLRAHGVDPAAGPALLLGAGGGGARGGRRAAGCRRARVTVANRSPSRADSPGARPARAVACIDWDAAMRARWPTMRCWSTRPPSG